MSFHRFSQVFPLLEGQPFDELVADIKEHGVREPIWLYEGAILDGRNRFRAAERAQREAPTREYIGDDPLKFVISLNMHRRHLDESQRSMVAAKIATLHEGRPSSETASQEAVSQAAAAKIMKVGRSSVQRARKVIERAAPEVVQAVERGELAVKVAEEILEAPKGEQVTAVKQGGAAVKELRKRMKDPKREQADMQHQALAHLRDFAVAIEVITPRSFAKIVPDWLIEPKGKVLTFLSKAAKLSTERRRKSDRKWRAWRTAQAKRRRQREAKASAKAKAAKTRKRIRAAKAPTAVRRPARRTGDTKQRRSAKHSRVTRRLSHSSVSA